MVKYLISWSFLSIVLFGGQSTLAQLGHTITSERIEQNPDFYMQQRWAQWRASGSKSRLIATSSRNLLTNGDITDSLNFQYSGENGWDSMVNEWKYDIIKYYGTYPIYEKNYDNNKRLITYNYKSSVVRSKRKNYQYVDLKILSINEEELSLDDGKWYPFMQTSFSYNPLGQQINRNTSNYGSLGNLVMKTATTYSYDSNGITGIIDSFFTPAGTLSRMRNTYFIYAVGVLSELNIGGNRFFYQRDGSGNVVTAQHIYLNTNLSNDSIVYAYTYNNSGDIIKVLTKGIKNGKDSNIYSIEATYNQLHQVEWEKYTRWDKASRTWQDDRENRYYYQPVFPLHTLDIALQTKPTLWVYPVPASGIVSVTLKGYDASNSCQFAIHNINGTQVRTWSHKIADSHYTEQVDLSQLPAGTYLLRTDNGQYSQTRIFILQ